MTYREQLYFLLREYINKNYTTDDFCDYFVIIFNTKINHSSLSKVEYDVFSSLCDIAVRYSPYEEDLKIPNCFFNESDVRKKAEEVCKVLNV